MGGSESRSLRDKAIEGRRACGPRGPRSRLAARRRPPRARHRAPPSGFAAPAPVPCREPTPKHDPRSSRDSVIETLVVPSRRIAEHKRDQTDTARQHPFGDQPRETGAAPVRTKAHPGARFDTTGRPADAVRSRAGACGANAVRLGAPGTSGARVVARRQAVRGRSRSSPPPLAGAHPAAAAATGASPAVAAAGSRTTDAAPTRQWQDCSAPVCHGCGQSCRPGRYGDGRGGTSYRRAAEPASRLRSTRNPGPRPPRTRAPRAPGSPGRPPRPR